MIIRVLVQAHRKVTETPSPLGNIGHLADLFDRATREEQEFLARLILGEPGQGALSGIMAKALAKAADVPATEVTPGSLTSVLSSWWRWLSTGFRRAGAIPAASPFDLPGSRRTARTRERMKGIPSK